MKTLRIIHLNTSHEWRGGERQVLNLAQAFKKEGLCQLVICQPQSELEKRCLQADIPVSSIRMRGEVDLLAVFRIVRRIGEFRANLLHAHTAQAHALGVIVKMRIPSLRLLVSRRVDFHIGRNPLSRIKYKTHLVDRYIAVSAQVKKILTLDGINESKIGVVHSGIDLGRQEKRIETAYLRREFKIKKGEIILGNVAALVDHKDQETLLKAMAQMPDPGQKIGNRKFPLYRLFILGEGDLREKLISMAKRYDLLQKGRLIFTGFRNDVMSFYSLMHIFVLSSKEEGLGTAVLDAMHAGLPVAATMAGGIPEMIENGRGGLLAPVRDYRALAEVLQRLMLYPALRREMGAYNKKRVKKFSMNHVFRETLKEYKLVLNLE